MKKVVLLYKKLGQTPLELLKEFKKSNLSYTDVKMAYAGRLDPMAHGLMVYLVGDECKNRDAYQDMSKTYEFELVLGVRTDTHDALGILVTESMDKLQVNHKDEIQKLLENLVGELEQEYPSFSSKPIEGIPMYQLAKEGKLDGLDIPTKTIRIEKAALLNSGTIDSTTLLHMIKERITKVNGDFRQQDIIDRWEKLLNTSKISLPSYRIELTVSSGTYVRSIADQIGEQLGTYAIAFDILRTRVGEFTLNSVENNEDFLEVDLGVYTDSQKSN